MKQELDIQAWARKDHFEFFNKFDEPFFGITFNVNMTKAYAVSKENKLSLYIYYLHKCLSAANQIESFSYRIDGDKVYKYDCVNASPTVDRPGGTFGFSYIDYHEDFDIFNKKASMEIQKVRNSKGLVPSNGADNTIHFSALPWINFTSVTHARHYAEKDSIPKITFGKIVNQGNQKLMSVSIYVNHALMDGADIGAFQEIFQEQLNITK
jgi:chloramphenicol O-acetyltransferase type A